MQINEKNERNFENIFFNILIWYGEKHLKTDLLRRKTFFKIFWLEIW